MNKPPKFNRLIRKAGLICIGILLSLQLYAQQRTVTGTIVDDQGEGMPGVNVLLKGTTTGVVTDYTGKFSIQVPGPDAVLQISFIGYTPQEMVVGTQDNLKVVLAEDITELDEIVVVGYGVQRRRDVIASITTVKSSEITALPTSNALSALQGKVAGLDMNQSSGQVGETPNFSIRGNRSLKAENNPLILIDGVDYGTSLDINPSDIESIEVLKDAASTAIYGTRGANGVIIVTTKKGQSGGTKVSFNAYGGFRNVTGQPDIMSGEEYIAFKREAYRTNGETDDSKIFAMDELEYIKNGYFTDWGDLVINDGSVQNYELSVTGGNDKTSVSLSLGLMNEKGLFTSEGLNRYNFRIAADHKLNNFIKAGANVIYTYRDKDARRDPLNMAYKIVPISRPYDDDGNFIMYPAPGYTSQMSPLADEQPGAYVNNTICKRFFASGYLDINFLRDFYFKSTFGVDIQDQRRGWYYGKYSIDGGGTKSQSGIDVERNSINYTWENVLNYTKTLGRHNIQALGGTSTIFNRNEPHLASGKEQISPVTEFYNLGTNSSEYVISSGLVQSQMVSFFGRVNYKFNERYLFSASFRADGSSVLAPGNKWGYFPSVSAGWRLSEEEFLRGVSWLSSLKLRASWGEAGNSAISPYQTLASVTQSVYAFNENPAYGYFPANVSNKKLSWETTATTNIGIDFGFFNNRLTGAIDVYRSDTRDLLMEKLLPPTAGYLTTWDNIGKTRNTGIEVALESANMPSAYDFQWTTSLTMTHNKEEIVALSDGVTRDENNGWFVGEPIKVWYDYNKTGIWQLGEETEAAKNGQKPGEIKVHTSNADGKVSPEDRTFIGTIRPKFSFGLNNRFSYKGIELNVFLYGKFGQKIKSDAVGAFKYQGLENAIMTDYWTPENPTNEYPRPDSKTNTKSYTSTLGYINGNFLKIRDITLAYNLPARWFGRLPVSSVRIYATAKNYFTFCDSRLKPFDPERHMNGASAVSFPMMKEMVFGLNLNF